MRIDDLKPSITELAPQQALDLVIMLRQSRRTSKRIVAKTKSRAKPGVPSATAISSLPKEELATLIKQLEEMT